MGQFLPTPKNPLLFALLLRLAGGDRLLRKQRRRRKRREGEGTTDERERGGDTSLPRPHALVLHTERVITQNWETSGRYISLVGSKAESWPEIGNKRCGQLEQLNFTNKIPIRS